MPNERDANHEENHMTDRRALADSTTVVVAGRPVGEGQPLNQPIVLASNFRAGPEYARTHGTESWRALEQAVGALEQADCVSFASGMAAASAVLFALHPRVVIVPRVSYLGVRSLLADMTEHGTLSTIEVELVDDDAQSSDSQNRTTVSDALEAALAGQPADRVILWLETPSNPMLDQADIKQLSELASSRGVRTVVDSTFATPIASKPITLGADVVLHAGTKFIGGHSDLLIGLVCARDESVIEALRHARVVQGATPGALESFLALRGLRTLHLRYNAASANAAVLAARLKEHTSIEWVKCVGPMVSYIVHGGADAADRVCASTEVIVPATSLGGVETTMERRQKYAGDAHVNPGLIRMSVGIEDVDDLWADLSDALNRAR